MKGQKVVITGGAGFIGSNIAKALAKENQVIVIDDLSTGYIKNIQNLIDTKQIEFMKGSVTDRTLLQRTFSDVDVVFHLAAVVSVPKSIKDPITTHEVNVTGTLNVLLAAKDNAVDKVVFSSSCAVYGDPSEGQLPLKETTPLHPMSPYATSKFMGEYYCNIFSEIYALPTVCLRYFNVYGPHQDPYSEYAAVIPKFISSVSQEQSPIIYSDGKQTRDFIFIKDVVNANILAAESKVTGVFNIGSGTQISVNDLTRLIMKRNNKKLYPVYKKQQIGDIRHSLADISKAKEKLGYKPKFNVTKGLEETVKWIQNQA